MSTSDDMVLQVLDDIVAKIAASNITKNSLAVYDEDDLFNKLKNSVTPAVGVIYMGSLSVPEQDKDTNKRGLAARSSYGVLLINKPDPMTQANYARLNINILSNIRRCIASKDGPNGRAYRWESETAAKVAHGNVLWLQRYSIPIMMTPRGV